MSKNIRFDVGKIDSAQIDDKGYLRAKAYATRTGVFTYVLSDGTIRRELRHPDEVFSKDSIESLKEIVVTNNHPPEKLNSSNTKYFASGWTGKDVVKDGKYIQVNTTITDQEAIDQILNEGKQELSCGYDCEVEDMSGEYEGERYDAIQKNIKYNHISIVDKGRAGPEVKIKFDSNDNFGVMKTDEIKEKEKKPVQIDQDCVTYGLTYDVSLKKSKEFNKMTKIKIDSVEYEVSESVAQVMASKLKEIESLQSEKESLQGKVDAYDGELKAKEEKIKELESRELSDKEIIEKADSLRKVHSMYDDVLNGEGKKDGLTLLEMKKAVLSKLKPGIDFSVKADSYIDGVFDVVSESFKSDQSEKTKEQISEVIVSNKGKKFDANDAYLNSMKNAVDAFNSYKGV